MTPKECHDIVAKVIEDAKRFKSRVASSFSAASMTVTWCSTRIPSAGITACY